MASVPDTTEAILTFKIIYPGVDLLLVVARKPRLLLQRPEQMREDAAKVCNFVHCNNPGSD